MNFKKLTIIFLILLSLMLCISVASAADNATDVTNPEDTVNNKVPDAATDSTNDGAAKEDTTKSHDNNKKTTTSKNTNKKTKPIRTDVDADGVVVAHKKKGYFKVKVENDRTDEPVKNLKLKIKVFTKSKSKTYKIKTNSRGIAKFNTKVLGKGNHKVIVTSDDPKYKVYKKSKIFVGKKHKITLKPNSKKKLKNKDILRVYTKSDDDEKEIKVRFKGSPKKTNIIKAVFYLKNKATGKIIKKTDFVDFDDGKWEYPDEDYSYRFTAVKVKITYVTI